MIQQISTSLPYPVYRAKQVRENEAKIAAMQGLSMMQLMENAGLAAFNLLQRLWPQAQQITVVCGLGNNAGDGFVLARHALLNGYIVNLVCINADIQYQGEALNAKQQYLDAGGIIKPWSAQCLRSSDVIIDAIFGTGLSRALKHHLNQIIEQINQDKAPVLALDIPSGLCAETGKCFGSVINAENTITFVALKSGMFTGKSANYVGKLYLDDLDIGQSFYQHVKSEQALTSNQLLNTIPMRKACSHKGDSGFALIIAGNKDMPGAARMSAEACLRAGAGLVAVHCHPENRTMVVAGRPELMLSSEGERLSFCAVKADVVVVGPGFGRDQWAQSLFQQSHQWHKIRVVDADALHLLAQSPFKNDDWILTPHPGEAAKLLNCSVEEIEQDRFNAAKNIVDTYGGICVLKGAGTIICDKKNLFINTSGNPGMASGGMGDVLSGIIAALLLAVPDRLHAVATAVFLHGLAADRAAIAGMRGLLATDLLPEIRSLVNYSNESINH